jgi:hypothetical protein
VIVVRSNDDSPLRCVSFILPSKWAWRAGDACASFEGWSDGADHRRDACGVLLAFDLADERRAGCLGFSIERTDVGTGDRRWLPNSLRFMSDPNPEWVTTARAPLQKFRWGDYTTEPGRLYRYRVVARYGTPAEIQAQGVIAERPGGFDAIPGGVTLELRTEDCRNEATSIFFNRGAAASQAYVNKFGDNDPDDIPEALTWLSRGLEEGLVAFIAKADGPDFALHGCIYEFEKPTPIQALIQAQKRGAEVHIVYHARKGGNTAEENRHAIESLDVTFPTTPRTQGSAIMHNKYLVLSRKDATGALKPIAVWTGGTNWTEGGIYGQLNVGHAVYDTAVAETYEAGFQVLAQDLSINDTQARTTSSRPRRRTGRRCGTARRRCSRRRTAGRCWISTPTSARRPRC